VNFTVLPKTETAQNVEGKLYENKARARYMNGNDEDGKLA
jgi:hypothetical protein